ncbi:MAG: vWA domain-containing protein [Bacteroidia bacterium]
MKKILYIALVFAFCTPLFKAQGQVTTRVLFIFDASYSMYDTWDKTPKIDFAKRVLVELVDSLKTVPNLQMGLRTLGADYPLYPKRNCEDTRLVVPFAANNANDIESQIKAIEPKGTTPIAYTLGKCVDDFPACTNCRNIIILITDGIEECGGDPCEAAKEMQKKGILLKPFVIGIGKEEFSSAYTCVGKFFDVKQEEDFRNILKVVISQALNNTTAQVNLLDVDGHATETDVAMSFYDENTGRLLYNFMHTINDAGNPDTVTLDPNTTYHMVVHTIPEVEKHNITLTSGKHNIIAVKAPQGYLHLVMEGDNEYKALFAIIRKEDDMQTLNVQGVESTDKYIVGKYDLEILTMPRMYVKGVKVSESTTTTVKIPQAGYVSITKPGPGPLSLYLDDGGKMQWVCNLDANPVQENVIMQPGHYRVVYRSLNIKQTIYTVDKTFDVKPGSSTVVTL